MSLLDRRHKTVTVYPQTKTRDQYGEWELTDGAPVPVNVMVQPVQTEEIQVDNGILVSTLRRLIGRGPWPGGTHSVVEFDGRRWDQYGEARQYVTSRRTAHFDVVIQSRGAEVK